MSVPPNPQSAVPSSHRPKSRVPRRGLIGAIGAVAVGAGLTPIVSAATDSGSTAEPSPEPGKSPENFPRTRSKTATGESTVEADFPIGYVGVRWSGPHEGGEIRVLAADGSQGAWNPLGSDGCSVANGGAALLAVDRAAGFEVKAPQGATGVRCVALDTVRGPKRRVAVPSDTTRMRGVPFLTRAAWGADESKRFLPDGTENSPTAYYPFQTITVHHTAGDNDDPDPAATVRAIYDFHAVTNDWGDIGYHFLIDEEGTIYEGRFSGDDGFPAHDKDGNLVTAFHVGGFNSGNLGIALLGTLTEQGPTDAARHALTKLVRVLCRYHGLDPKAQLTYTNPVNGTQKDVPAISGHRDWMETECPGAVMYEELTMLREAVAAGH